MVEKNIKIEKAEGKLAQVYGALIYSLQNETS